MRAHINATVFRSWRALLRASSCSVCFLPTLKAPRTYKLAIRWRSYDFSKPTFLYYSIFFAYRAENTKIDSIASCIAGEWNGGYLLEANAGPGILSSSLLKNGIHHLRVFEKNKEFLTALEVLVDQYPSLEIIQHDLMHLPSLEFRKQSEPINPSPYLKEFYELTFKDIPEYPWENGTAFQIFSVIASKKSHKFLRFLLAALPNRSTLFTFGRCDFFFLITETEYKCMQALPKENFSTYRWSTVLYNLFFEIKCLQKFSSNSKNFFYCTKSPKKLVRDEYFYLVKLTPKAELYSPAMTQEKLQDLFFFVRSHLAKRSDLVIKSIEQWIPFCGPRLIKEGMNVFMRFGDLSPSEILWLFNNLSSWPEYQNCNLRAFASKFNRKKFVEDDDTLAE